MPTPSGLVTKQELIDAQLDTAHLGRVVNSKDASGAPINTSTNRTGGVNKTLDALEAEYEQSGEDLFNQFETTFSAQFTYKRIGNISDYAGQSLPEADKLNSYQYPDDSDAWYAPVQGQSFPITIPSDPTVSGSGWVLTASPNIYRGLWPDTGGSANKGETWQTQTGGIPTGKYFTALQNTTVAPVSDDVNWREVISAQSLGDPTNYVAANIENMKQGIMNGGVIIDLTQAPEGVKVSWLGYYERSDGGGNWGVIKKGAHVDDGGSIFSIDASTYIEANIKGTVNLAKFGCVGQVSDVSDNFQNALNVVDGKITSLPGVTHTTSQTLFNQKPNRLIDMRWSKIKNQTNSRFAIVSVSEALTTQDDSALAAFMEEAHFDEQLERASIVNVEIEMLPNTSGGSNLCIGMIYCKFSKQKAKITASNSNATQIQGSFDCNSDIVTDGHRGYGTFNYMSKYTKIKLNTTGGTRGVIVKHAYYDDPDVDCVIDIIAKNVNGRSIGGGASAGTGASPALEPSGHEIVRGVNIKRARLTTDSTFDYQPDIIVGYHADKWKFNDIQIRNKSTDTNTFNVNIGGEGTAGFFVGGGHVIDGLDIEGAKADAVPVISLLVPTELRNSTVNGKYFKAVAFGPLINANTKAECKIDNLKLFGELINTGTGRGIIEVDSSVDTYTERDLTVRANAAENTAVPSRTQLAIVYASSRVVNQSGQRSYISLPSGCSTTSLNVNVCSGSEMHSFGGFGVIDVNSQESATTSIIGINTSAVNHQILANYLKITNNVSATTLGIRFLSSGGTPSLNTFNNWQTDQSGF